MSEPRAKSALNVDQREIELTHPDKILFPDIGLSKADLADYYQRVAPTMLPHIRGRPLTLRRFPNGINESGFFQQNRGDYFPDWLPAETVAHGGDTGEVTHMLCEQAADLVYLAGQGALTLHAWLSRRPQLRCPDQLIFDLDPPAQDFEPVRVAARQLGDALHRAGITSFVKTTGSRGLHVVVVLNAKQPFDQARAVARRLADRLAQRYPDTLTTEQRKNKRHGRLYLDIMRNAFGQTAVAPYSVRAKPGAPVATPLEWDELEDSRLHAQRYTVGNLFRRLGQRPDPWKDMARHSVDLDRLEHALAD